MESKIEPKKVPEIASFECPRCHGPTRNKKKCDICKTIITEKKLKKFFNEKEEAPTTIVETEHILSKTATEQQDWEDFDWGSIGREEPIPESQTPDATLENKKREAEEALKKIIDECLQKLEENKLQREAWMRELAALDAEEAALTPTIEKLSEPEKIEAAVATAITEVETENTETITTEVLKALPLLSKTENKKGKINWKSILGTTARYLSLSISIATAIAFRIHTPPEYYSMAKNWKERHIEKKNTNDPEIKGIENAYEDTTIKDINNFSNETISVQKSTYDFLGSEKLDYKSGYYMTSVFDLTDQTPPKFKILNDRNPHSQIDGAAGITTSLLGKFLTTDELVQRLKGKEDDKEIQEVPVVAYNTKTMMMKAGHLKEFNSDWLVSQTNEQIIDFKLNDDGTVPLTYDHIVMRMVPVMSVDQKGTKHTLQIGVTRDQNTTKINPYEATRFGTLEGGKVLLVCGKKQLQVNGSFADVFRVYEKLKKDYPGVAVHSYLLDNGAFNLPIWDKDNTITSGEIEEHRLRHYTGGYALVLMNDGAISPYEYQSKYTELAHSMGDSLDEKSGKILENEKSVMTIESINGQNAEQLINNATEERSAHVIILKDGTRHLFGNDNTIMANQGFGIKLESGKSRENEISIAQLESMLEYMRPRIEKYGIPLENIQIPASIEEKMGQELIGLIGKKLYNTENPELAGAKANQMVGILTYQEAYRVTKNKDYALAKVRSVLSENNVSKRNINRTVEWINKKVA